jgi:hypothetical protein
MFSSIIIKFTHFRKLPAAPWRLPKAFESFDIQAIRNFTLLPPSERLETAQLVLG